jgi:hypothetical protein
MNIQHRWNGIDRGNGRTGENTVPVPLCPRILIYLQKRILTKKSENYM